jgi:hypothetical protein
MQHRLPVARCVATRDDVTDITGFAIKGGGVPMGRDPRSLVSSLWSAVYHAVCIEEAAAGCKWRTSSLLKPNLCRSEERRFPNHHGICLVAGSVDYRVGTSTAGGCEGNPGLSAGTNYDG